MYLFHCMLAIAYALAVPNFEQARKSTQRNACISNLRQIEGAVEQAKMDGIFAPTASDIYGADKFIKVPLVCPTTKKPYVLKGTGESDWRPVCPNPTVNGSRENERHALPSW